MVRVCTADRLSCAKVVYLVYTAKRLGLDAPFCACFEKNVFCSILFPHSAKWLCCTKWFFRADGVV